MPTTASLSYTFTHGKPTVDPQNYWPTRTLDVPLETLPHASKTGIFDNTWESGDLANVLLPALQPYADATKRLIATYVFCSILANQPFIIRWHIQASFLHKVPTAKPFFTIRNPQCGALLRAVPHCTMVWWVQCPCWTFLKPLILPSPILCLHTRCSRRKDV